VLSWIGFQRTLSDRDARSGLAEVVKSALIEGDESLQWLEHNVAALVARDENALHEAVTIAARVKVAVVSEDPLEHGRRRVLNLGHTFGHALEHSLGYGELTHGEAVSIGLCMALALCRDLGYAPSELGERVEALLEQLHLPVEAPRLSVSQWMTPLSHDKKVESDAVRFIVCRKPGDVFDERLSLVQIQNWLARQPCVCGSEGA
jgi:3-dehydroquinate synthase